MSEVFVTVMIGKILMDKCKNWTWMVWVSAVQGLAASDALPGAVKDKRVLYGIRVTIYYAAVTGTCDSLNLVISGYKQLWQPLGVNRLPCAQELCCPNIVPAVPVSDCGLVRQGDLWMLVPRCCAD